MKALLAAAGLAAMLGVGVGVGVGGRAVAQPLYYAPPFQVQPTLPETLPTWSQDAQSGTARHDIAATPGCGAANPQGGVPSMWTGTCP